MWSWREAQRPGARDSWRPGRCCAAETGWRLVLLVGVVVAGADGGVLAALDRLVAVRAVAVAVPVGGLHGLGEGLVGVRHRPDERAAGDRGRDAVGVFLDGCRQGLEDLLGVDDRALFLGERTLLLDELAVRQLVDDADLDPVGEQARVLPLQPQADPFRYVITANG